MTDRPKRQDSLQKQWERYYPWLAACFVPFGASFYFAYRGVPTRFELLFNATVSIAAIAVGFLGTAKTVLLSLENRRIVRQMKAGRGEYYDRLLGYMMQAIVACFALAVLSGAGLLVDLNRPQAWHAPALTIWVCVLTFAVCTCWRVVGIFSVILRSRD